MRGPVRCCLLFALSVAVCRVVSADTVELGEVRTVNPTTRTVDVTYSYTSQHGDTVLLLLRPSPRALLRSIEVEPLSRRIGRGNGTVTFTLRTRGAPTEPLSVRRVLVGFAEEGAGQQRLFFTDELETALSWAAGPTGSTPVPGAQTTPITTTPSGPIDAQGLDQPIQPGRIVALRRAIAALVQRLGVAREQAIRDRRLMRLMLRHMAVSQEQAAEAGLEVAENLSDYDPGQTAFEGADEVTVGGTAFEGADEVPAGPRRITALTSDGVEVHERGCFVFNFSYEIGDAADVLPLTFDVEFEGSANQWITQQPWVHASPGRNYRGHGFVTAWVDSPQAPLSLGSVPVRVRVRGSTGNTYASYRITPGFAWYKSYDMITHDNLKDYCAGPDAVLRDQVGINEGPNSLAEYFHSRYDAEPPMLIFRTAENTYARGYFLPHLGDQGLQGVWLVDLTTFDSHGPYWVDGHVPADWDDWFLSRRSYDNGAFLTEGARFDLDYYGLNCTPEQADLVVEVDNAGKYFLSTRNGCRMYY